MQVLISIDQVFNALLAGYADETLSARSYRMSKETNKKRWKFMRRFIDTLFFWQKEHCLQAYLSEKTKRHFSEYYSKGDITG